ncbi:ethanolamine ammonia lyase large subunit [Salmonella enterica subsp. enterica serovar Typhimurium]|nr:ethanolamine ammonia lyase large subunit [Salmonella enterica subsp. enterica serovar Typhimurium]
MKLKTTLFGNVYQFKDVKEVLAKANELRSGGCAGRGCRGKFAGARSGKTGTVGNDGGGYPQQSGDCL